MNLDNKNIVLIGFMGSGKSSIGRVLANSIKYCFLDTDSLIETFENKTISDIFNSYGENYFRQKEKECVNWLKNVKKSVISTGGGMPIYAPDIKDIGVVIYIKLDFDIIVKRLSKKEIKKRPLFQDIDKAKELYDKRDKIYSSLADYIVINERLDKSVAKIKELLWK